MAKFRIGGNGTDFQVEFDTRALDVTIAAAPRAAYRRLRDYFFQTLLDHRKVWLQSKSSRFGRGEGGRFQPIGVSRIQSERETPKPNEVIYVVQPAQRRAETAREAETKLNQMRADIFTGNTILPVHEFGTDIRSKRGFMSVPIRTRLGPKGRGQAVTPGNWRKANPGKILTLRRGHGGVLFLYEVVPVFSRANKRKGIERQHVQDRLKMRFMLTRKVDMKPTLRFYESWQKAAGLREAAWSKAMSKLQSDLDEGRP